MEMWTIVGKFGTDVQCCMKKPKPTPPVVSDATVPYLALGILPRQEDTDLIGIIRKGLPHSVLSRLRTIMEISTEELASILHVSSRTLARHESSRKALSPDHTEKVIELATLYSRGAEVFGTRAAFMAWMSTPVPSLGDKMPRDFLDTSIGIKILMDELGRIEHGVYS